MTEQFPDKVRQARAKTILYSPKPETAVLATLEKVVGKPLTDQVRALGPVAEDDSDTADETNESP